jgi:Ni/Co efflux regulator RcnB
MRKTILTILGSAALATSFVQVAAATERHHARKAEHAVVGQTVRDSNAAWGNSDAQPNWSRYEGGAISAPAGH